jgi:hypothetical protein
MQNKANLLDTQMNVSAVNTREYENISNWTLGENKPKQSQPVVSLPAPSIVEVSNLFQSVERLLALEQIAAIIILTIKFLEISYV